MKTTVLHQVTQLTFMPLFFPVNVYLVEEENGLTLIDCGMSFMQQGITEAAFRIGKPITTILLTHAHPDHVGALDGLKQRFPEAELAISARDALLLRGDTSLAPGEPDAPVKNSLKGIQAVPDRLLKDGDLIASLQAVASPGHTPGHMAFLDRRSGVLIAGDAFQTRGGMAVSGDVRWNFPFPAWATWHKATALHSARRLSDLRPQVLACGHGSMVLQPYDAMQQVVARAASRFEGHR
ncbi:MBL fold metallo-hydrolase [Paenibacillus algicola]|uniref:MBL fold metallo-hydrolase n=1 Tax=Paenibacillus algicola TaxID=2565926 RepID=UPI0038993221